jgi:cysteine synthase B
MRSKDILDSIGFTPLVELRGMSPKATVRIFAKLEGNNPTGSVKDRIAKYMLDEAERNGELKQGKVILEASTGNTGIALAMVGRRKGYRVKIVVPENVMPEIRQVLELYGAEIVWSEGKKSTHGAIDLARQMAEDPQYYAPVQFSNPANVRAHYETTGAEIAAALPEVDVFIAGLGTGGTLMGVGRRLREQNPDVRIIAAEPHADEIVQGLHSLEDGFIPPILDLAQLNGKMVVRSVDAFAAARELTRREGMFAGVSSGAVMHCARRVAKRMKSGNIVVLFADAGWKYLTTRLWTRSPEELARIIDGKLWW